MLPIKSILTLAGAVLIVILGFIGWQKWRDLQRDAATAAKTKTEVYIPKVAESKDSIKIHEPGIAVTDTNLSRGIRHVVTRPTVTTGGHITKDSSAAKDTTQYVTLQKYNELDSTYKALKEDAETYRDTTRLQLLRYPRLVAFQDSVTKYQKVQIETGHPRRRWALGFSLGPGVAYVPTEKVAIAANGTPVVTTTKEVKMSLFTANVGLTFSF